MTANTPIMPWADRTVGTGHMSPEDLMKAANPLNPRIHPDYQAEAVEGLLDQVGFVKRVIVNQTTGRVIDGHLRIKLALAKGAPTIPVEYVELSEAEERLVLATLDPTAALAEFDAEALARLGEEVKLDFDDFDLSTFFKDDEFAALMGNEPDSAGEDTEPAIDRAAELQAEYGTKLGQIWQLGRHRLAVGDCTDAAVVEALMDGEKGTMVFTSPPYAEQRKDHYEGKPADKYVEWWGVVNISLFGVTTADASEFININSHSKDIAKPVYVYEMVSANVRDFGWLLLDEFCWERIGIPGDPVRMGKFKNQWESVFWFSKVKRPKFYPDRAMIDTNDAILDNNWQPALGKRQGQSKGGVVGDREIGRGKAYPGNRIKTKVNEALGHPAAFDIGLPSFFLPVFSDNDDIIIDPFSGSGTTIIAAENLNRQCRAIEIDPGYAAVSIHRWKQHTKQKAQLVNE